MNHRNILLLLVIKIVTAQIPTETPTSVKPSACNDALRKKFEEWKAQFKITYQTIEEENLRREIFCANARKVQSHNGGGNATYTTGENKHSDKTNEERNNNMLGAKKPPNDVGSKNKVGNRLEIITTTASKNKVGRTKATKTSKTKATKTKKSKSSVQNKLTTTPSTIRTSPTSTVRVPSSAATPMNQPQTTKRTTFPWTTKSKPTTRAPPQTTSRTQTTMRPTTTTQPTFTTSKAVSSPETIQYTVNQGSAPDYVNYTADCTTPKDQYGCGACWAFSAVGVTEYWNNKAKKYANFSEQQILDCNPFGDDCDGGWPTNAFTYMINPGNSDGASYIYRQKKGDCMEKVFPPIVKIPKVCEVELNGNETLLKELVWQRGPISVVIYVLNVMYSYKTGIFYEANCPSNIYNHAIVVVGYGSFGNGSDYWIIKNSWGTTWGYGGYGLMARNRNNNCAIATYAMYPC